MVTILSPAKTLDFTAPERTEVLSRPRFLSEAAHLVEQLRAYDLEALQAYLKVSGKIAEEVFTWYRTWRGSAHSGSEERGRAALFAYRGEVYRGFDAATLSPEALAFADRRLRILSGLYGILKPLDHIEPYRLDIGFPYPGSEEYGSLYDFWGDRITEALLDTDDSNPPTIVNLASGEYARAIRRRALPDNTRIIEPIFREVQGDSSRVIGMYAKRARGLMARFIVDNRIDTPEDLTAFSDEGYSYAAEVTAKPGQIVFLRTQSVPGR